MLQQYNLITGLSEYFKSDTQNIKNTYKVINNLRTELAKNATIVNLTDVKKKYNITLQNLKKDILDNGSEVTLYNIFESKLTTNEKLNNKDLAVLGLKFNDIGSFLSNYIKSNPTFSIIIRLLPLLDAFYYYTDKDGKEIPYVFFALSLKLSNQNIQIADIEFILEFILLLYILDTDEYYYDNIKFEYDSNNITNIKKAVITNDKIKNPINILIYIYNSKIELDNKSMFLELFTANIPLFGSIKDISYLNLEKYLNYAVQDNSNSAKLSNKSKYDYYTSFGHYLGHILKFYIENDKYKIPQLKHLQLLVKLRDDLIKNNNNFYKYRVNSGTQLGGSLISFFKLNKLYINVSHYATSKLNIIFHKVSTTLSNKLINIHLDKQPNLSHLLNSNDKYSLKYYIESPEYSVFPLLLLSTTYDIINTFSTPSGISPVSKSSATHIQYNILNNLLTKDVLKYCKKYIHKYSKKTRYANIVIIYGGLLKYLPVIIGLKLNLTDINMTKKINNYIDYFLYVISKINKIEADIINKLLYCMVITINLYNYGYIYYYKVNSSINIDLKPHGTKKPINTKKYKLTEDQNTLLYELLKKIAKSIILDTDTFSSNIIEIILLYKLHNINKINKYSLFENKLDLNNNELELLNNIFNTIIADDIYDMRYLVSIGTLNFCNKKKIIPQSAGNPTRINDDNNSDNRTPTPSTNDSNSSKTIVPRTTIPSLTSSSNIITRFNNNANNSNNGNTDTKLTKNKRKRKHKLKKTRNTYTNDREANDTNSTRKKIKFKIFAKPRPANFTYNTNNTINTSNNNYTNTNISNNSKNSVDNTKLHNQEPNNTTRNSYWFNRATNLVIGTVTTTKNLVIGAVTTTKNLVIGTAKTTAQQCTDFAKSTAQHYTNALSDAVNNASGVVNELMSNISSTVSDTASATMNEGMQQVNAILNLPPIATLRNVSDEFLSNLINLMREHLNKPQKFDMNANNDMNTNNDMNNITTKLNKINQKKYKEFIDSKQTKEYKEFTLLYQLKKFCNKLLEWQFVVSHVILEDKLKYTISNNIFMSKYSEILLQNADIFNNKDSLNNLLNELINEKNKSKILFINL